MDLYFESPGVLPGAAVDQSIKAAMPLALIDMRDVNDVGSAQAQH
jgi:hypothetical protein